MSRGQHCARPDAVLPESVERAVTAMRVHAAAEHAARSAARWARIEPHLWTGAVLLIAAGLIVACGMLPGVTW